MKKLITILGLAGLTSFGVMAQNQEFVFDGRDYKDCVVGARPMDYNGDMKPDAYMVAYDLNKNGKIDHFAEYRQYLDSVGNVDYYYNPTVFYHDDDEDGIIEAAHIDNDMDGILETYKENPNVKKEDPKEPIKKKSRDTHLRRT